MDEPLEWIWVLDGWIVAAGVLCAVAASLVGNFLVLRRMSMLGDAISHAVLPGLAAAFLITGSRSSWPMFVGAVIVGIMTALLTQWIRDRGKVDEGASMGVVFTSLFALGLVMIVRAADQVDLDPGCVLYGAIEMTPLDTVAVGGDLVGHTVFIPRVVLVLAAVTLVNLLFVVLFFKELRLTSFDPALADTSGFSARAMHYALMTLVAITAVASFESVGNLLVVAMLVVPAATASLLTDRLSTMVVLSALIAALSAVAGHIAAITLPRLFGFGSTTTAGMMAVMTGVAFVAAMVLAPRRGLIAKAAAHLALAWQVVEDDLLAYLYRHEESNEGPAAAKADIASALRLSAVRASALLGWNVRRKTILQHEGGYRLTPSGRARASSIVRSHRLWEQYLVDQAGLPTHRIHGQAERLEHFTDRGVRDQLERETQFPEADPHGRAIPAEQPAASRDG